MDINKFNFLGIVCRYTLMWAEDRALIAAAFAGFVFIEMWIILRLNLWNWDVYIAHLNILVVKNVMH